jgi:hypothetical protein
VVPSLVKAHSLRSLQAIGLQSKKKEAFTR